MQYFDANQSNIRKSIVHFVVLIFGLVIILIFILLVMYYITPNNYELLNWDENKFILQNQIEYMIKPNTTINIENIYLNKYLRFSSQTNLIIKNVFKSQNIIINKNEVLVKSKYNSEILLSNNSDIEEKVVIYFYSLNY